MQNLSSCYYLVIKLSIKLPIVIKLSIQLLLTNACSILAVTSKVETMKYFNSLKLYATLHNGW